MSSFLYFLPGATSRPSPSEIASRGLAYALAGASLDLCVCGRGPDELAGIVLVPNNRSEIQVGFYPDKQGWRRLSDQAYVGFLQDQKPGPGDLERQKMIGGHAITLGDGQSWTVPAARAWEEVNGRMQFVERLPSRQRLGEDGSWSRGDVLPDYRDLHGVATAWWNSRVAAANGDGRFTIANAANQATLALAVNYRLGPVETDILGLWTDETVLAVLDATIDAQSYMELSKKKAGDQ